MESENVHQINKHYKNLDFHCKQYTIPFLNVIEVELFLRFVFEGTTLL